MDLDTGEENQNIRMNIEEESWKNYKKKYIEEIGEGDFSNPSHILLFFSSEPPPNPRPYTIIIF